jgi:hypothetical protein
MKIDIGRKRLGDFGQNFVDPFSGVKVLFPTRGGIEPEDSALVGRSAVIRHGHDVHFHPLLRGVAEQRVRTVPAYAFVRREMVRDEEDSHGVKNPEV